MFYCLFTLVSDFSISLRWFCSIVSVFVCFYLNLSTKKVLLFFWWKRLKLCSSIGFVYITFGFDQECLIELPFSCSGLWTGNFVSAIIFITSRFTKRNRPDCNMVYLILEILAFTSLILVGRNFDCLILVSWFAYQPLHFVFLVYLTE